MDTYWRIQHMADPTSADWQSQIGLDEDDLGVESGTACCESFEALQRYARGGHLDWIGALAIIEMTGELLQRRGPDECLIRPTGEVRRIPLAGGRGAHRVSVVLPRLTRADLDA